MHNYSSKYDNFILFGDLNSEPTKAVGDFCEVYSCKNLIKDNNCFKDPLKPFSIDLVITNRPKSFQNSVTTETGLSDFRKMTLTVTKAFYKNKKQILSRTGIINAILIKRLCLTLKIVFFK